MSAERSLAVVPRAPHALTQPAEPDIFRVGEALAKSGYFVDARDAAQAVVKVIAGRELGIGDVQAMTGIYIVKGRVTLSANLMAALVKRSGRYNYRVVEMTEKRCEIQFFEDGQSCGKSAFTIEDARKAGTQNLDRFPRNMLFARAMSNGVRWFCPDVTTTPVYTPEEMGARVDGESGEVIEVEPVPQEPAESEEASALSQSQKARQAPPEAQHAPSQAESGGVIRERLLEHVVARCVELGYDTKLQLNSRAKAATMSDDRILKVVIPSLDKLIAEKRTELDQKITAELVGMGLDEEQMAGYVAENGGQGKKLEACSLAEMRAVAESLELQ